MRIARPMRRFKRTSYDGVYYAKIHSRVAVTAGSYTSGSVSVTWGSSGTSTTGIQFISDQPEFEQMVKVDEPMFFRLWKLNGVKIKVHPAQNFSFNVEKNINDAANELFYTTDVQIATFPGEKVELASDASNTEMARAVDYKSYSAG